MKLFILEITVNRYDEESVSFVVGVFSTREKVLDKLIKKRNELGDTFEYAEIRPTILDEPDNVMQSEYIDNEHNFTIQDCVDQFHKKYYTNIPDEDLWLELQEFVAENPDLMTAEEVIFKFEY